MSRIPVPAIAAGLLALLSSAIPAVYGLVGLIFLSGGAEPGDYLVLVLPLLVVCWFVVGGVLLLVGRSWLTAALPAAALTVLLLWGRVAGGLGGGPRGFGLFSLLVPAATAVLASSPAVRNWVAARRRARTAG